jgi:DNA-binding MarR family transcriptional regulator
VFGVPVATDQLAVAWESFFRATRRLRARATRVAGDGLSLPQFHLLEALLDEPELSVGVLAESAGVAAPTATRMLDCLARDGLVARQHSETDRRAVLVSLTDAGRDAVEAAQERVGAFRRRVFEQLDVDERRQAAAVLGRLTEIFERELS